jgi:putative transposase
MKSHGIGNCLGRGKGYDNLFIGRLWRAVKYEEVYPKAYQDGKEARGSLGEHFRFYNTERPHPAPAYRTPAEVLQKAPLVTCENHWHPTL